MFIVIILVSIISCEKDTSNILSKGKMEDVLYDYHLAQSMLEQLNYEERQKLAQAYIDAVFEKNNVTEAEFDSSLIYYNRHADELLSIYNNIKERYEEKNQELSLVTGNSEMLTVFSNNSDTTNIWNGANLIVLRGKEGINYETFNIPTDSSFYKQDRFILACEPIIMRENESDRNSYVNVGLTIRYKDGKTLGSTTRLSDSRSMRITLTGNVGKEIESVSGFFYYKSTDNFRNLALISNIALVRMHTIASEEVKKDSIKSDSIIKDTITPLHEERLSPEQIRERNQTKDRIEIKAAPDVRTPNSIGPRRRTARPRIQQ